MSSSTPLSEEEKKALLRIAREAVTHTVLAQPSKTLDLSSLPERLRLPGASFVTLTVGGQLRGCIGTLKYELPLGEDVQQHAIAAATRDYRFPQLRPDELGALEVEVSVLSEPEPLVFTRPEEIPGLLRPGLDGVVLIHGEQRSTFLPQVWSKIDHPMRFLEMLCQKAQLPPDAWRSEGTQISTYRVESFHEALDSV